MKEKIEIKYVKNKKYHKLRDHYHYTGEYRGAVHNIPIAFPIYLFRRKH